MNLRITVLSGCIAFLALATVAAADDAAPAPAAETGGHGEKEYKQRINTVARAPMRHDIEYIDGRDRTSWRGFDTWQGIRDERPLVARKTLGFHAPRPHATRWERVLLVSRGPLRGPAPSE